MRRKPVTFTINLFAITFSLIAFITSLASIVIVLAQKWSTHRIEWKPIDILPEDQKFKDEEEPSDSALVSEALNLSRKKKKKIEDPLDEILQSTNF